jgi:tetratricopeptide (TPR) repeat protein/class 3 adenylate cyclase
VHLCTKNRVLCGISSLYLPYFYATNSLHLSNSFLPNYIVSRIAEEETHGSFQASTICMDLSGFTALTAKLMEKGPQGAEEMSYALNNIFQPMVQAVYEAGGFIPYFAGDSFTGIFVEEAGQDHAYVLLHLADSIMHRFKHANRERGSLIAEYEIDVKIGLSRGKVEWGIVGRQHKSFYFRGEAINRSAYAQMRAERGQLCAHNSALDQIQLLIKGFRFPDAEYVRIDKILSHVLPKLPTLVPLHIPDGEYINAYFPLEVLQTTDRSGEFRSVTTVFIAFEGCADAILMQRFATLVLDQSAEFSGYFKEIDHGDKGGLMTILFGAPVAFENNTERALEFVLAIEEELRTEADFEPVKWKIGMSSGTAFTGIIGGKERNQYAAVGARVNLAARLMASAQWGQIITDENVQRNRNYGFEARGQKIHKGFTEPIESFLLDGRNQALKIGYSGHYIGREEELQKLIMAAQPLKSDRFAGITTVYGEPGIGKSRLSWEFRKQISGAQRLRWMVCRSDQILRKPFNPFLLFIKNYFEQKGDATTEANVAEFEANFNSLVSDFKASTGYLSHPEIEPDLYRLTYVLMALAGIKDENSQWPKLDGRTRYQLALQAMSLLMMAEACVQPIVIELEDAHWYDDMSKEFLQEFVAKAVQFPILFHVSSRYDDNGLKISLFNRSLLKEQQIPYTEIDLRYLSQADLTIFAENRLEGKISTELSDLLYRMSQGNPFYAEQLVEYFMETQLLVLKNGVYRLQNTDIKLSNSVKEIMMARIDRLSGLVKETVKAAAVIGREFEVDVLSGVMARNMEYIRSNGNIKQVLNEQIRTAEQGQIWHAINELRYIFKHSLLREAAYDMQLHTRLRDLHLLIAEVIESLYPNIEDRYFDLAFHFEQAGAQKQMQHYLELAGRYAQKNYQNKQALLCFDKLLESYANAGRKKHIKIWLRRGSVLEVIGQWDTALESYETALVKAMHVNDSKLIGRAYRRLGQLLMLRGDYTTARKYFEQAIEQFGLARDKVGIAKAVGNMGAWYFRQGRYEEARQKFLETIELNIAAGQEAENAPFVANLGLVAMNQSKYDEAIVRLEHQIIVNEAVHDKPGLATLYTNLGIVYLEKGVYENARIALDRGLALSEELDNKLFMTICMGSLGKVWERLGDQTKAMQLYDRDITLVENLGDKQGQSIAYNLKGELLSMQGQYNDAFLYLQKAASLARQLNYRKGLAKSLNALGDLYFAQNDLILAETSYLEALQLCNETGYKLLLCETHIELGEVYLASDREALALEQYQLALPLVNELNQVRIYLKSNELLRKLGV